VGGGGGGGGGGGQPPLRLAQLKEDFTQTHRCVAGCCGVLQGGAGWCRVLWGCRVSQGGVATQNVGVY